MPRALLFAVVATLPLGGCGLRGPLYLPDDASVQQSGARQGDRARRLERRPAPQAQKREPPAGQPADSAIQPPVTDAAAPETPDAPNDAPGAPAAP